MNEVREIKDLVMWDKFVESSPQEAIFCTSKWLELYDDAEYHIYGVYKGNNLVGGSACFDVPQPITPFQGILVVPLKAKYTTIMSLHNEVVTALLPYLPDEFACHYEFPDVRPFLWDGWQASVKYTYVVHPDWNEVEKDTRWEIKNANVEVLQSDDIELFNSLYDYTFTQKGLKRTASIELITKLFQTIPNKLYVSSDKSSAVMLIFDSKRAYYILGASTHQNTSSCVLWEAIRDLKEVDLVGCNVQKIDAFKRQFGGRLMPYYSLRR